MYVLNTNKLLYLIGRCCRHLGDQPAKCKPNPVKILWFTLSTLCRLHTVVHKWWGSQKSTSRILQRNWYQRASGFYRWHIDTHQRSSWCWWGSLHLPQGLCCHKLPSRLCVLFTKTFLIIGKKFCNINQLLILTTKLGCNWAFNLNETLLDGTGFWTNTLATPGVFKWT